MRRMREDLAAAHKRNAELEITKAAAEHVCTEQCSPCLGLHPGRAEAKK
jgi:hypothetical protein